MDGKKIIVSKYLEEIIEKSFLNLIYTHTHTRSRVSIYLKQVIYNKKQTYIFHK